VGLLTKIFGSSEGNSTDVAADSSVEGSASEANASDRAHSAEGRRGTVALSESQAAPRGREPTRLSPGTHHSHLNGHSAAAEAKPGLDAGGRPLQPAQRRPGEQSAAPDQVASTEEESRPGAALPAPQPGKSSGSRPPPSLRHRAALVVSPVSLTAEELALPKGSRPKMPTLLGLGAALGKPVLAGTELGPDDAGASEPSSDVRSDLPTAELSPTDAGRVEGAAAQTELSSEASVAHAVDDPEAWRLALSVLGDFSLKLSLGPLSPMWLAKVQRATAVLRSVAEQRVAKPHTSPLHQPEPHAAEAKDRAPKAQSALLTLTSRLDVSLEAAARRAVVVDAVPESGAVAALSADSLEVITAAPSSPVSEKPIAGRAREELLLALGQLPALLADWPAPLANLGREARRRERRILRELFNGLDGLNADRRSRVAQQMRLELLSIATPESLAQTFETSLERARELSQVLATYRAERQAEPPDVGNWVGLGRAVGELARCARDFDDCDEEQRQEQRLARRRRREASTRVDLLLAERGELELLQTLEPCCFAERIERLRAWLSSGTEKGS
jgi:hypothetical protein